MRKVLLRWKVSSLSGIDEIDKLMEICHRIEVLGHLSTDKEGVTQLVESVSYTHLTLPTKA